MSDSASARKTIYEEGLVGNLILFSYNFRC